MATIRYTVTTSSCSHCGYVLKRQSSFSILWFLLMICTCFTALFWVIGISILNAIFKYESVKLGSPFITCPRCGSKVITGEANEWGLLSREDKQNWAFRNKMRLCYVLSGTILFCLIIPLFGAWQSTHQSDRTIALVMLIVAILSVCIIGFMFYLRKKSYNEEYITVSESDYYLIKESWKRLYKIEPLLYETESIKISTTGKIVKPPIQKEQNTPKSIHNTTKETPKEDDLINKSINENKNQNLTNDNKNEQKSIDNNKKHVVIIRKKNDIDK